MGKWLGSLLFAVLLLCAPVREVVAAADLYAAVLPDERADVAAKTEGELSTYTLDLSFDPAASTIGGRERITFVNAFDRPLGDVAFRLYPNAFYYDEGGTTVDDVRVGGKAVKASLEVADTVLRVPLAEPVAPGKSVKLSLRFRTVVPADSDGTYGIFSHETAHGTWVLADWYPIVAGYEPGTGWRLDEPTAIGDPTFSDAALYDVTVTLPKALRLVGTGKAVAETPAGKNDVATRIVSGPAREFTMVVDDDYVAASTIADDGTRITIYTNPETGTADGAKEALATAAKALATYSKRYGVYPYEELDIVETDLAGALGVSWSGLIFLDGPDLLANPFYVESDPTRLDFTVAHEVGHQWWGMSVGANSNDHTFMVEGLTNYLADVYVEDSQGTEAARRQLQIQIAQPYLSALERDGDGVADQPITAPAEGPPAGALEYGKAALGFLAIREEIGDKAFFAGMADYAESFAYRNATPDDLRGAFERASGRDLGELWRFWFEEAKTTATDVQRLLDGM
jgi:Peptidase family M1 domain